MPSSGISHQIFIMIKAILSNISFRASGEIRAIKKKFQYLNTIIVWFNAETGILSSTFSLTGS